MNGAEFEVRPLTVGPIVGATGARSVRIWGRGEMEASASGPRRCFGVARLRPTDAAAFEQIRFVKMSPNFDCTGVAIFDQLEPTTDYAYEMGWFFADRELSDFDAGTALDWSRANASSFKTGSSRSRSPRTFVFGSCRYLLRVFGATLFDDRGDKTFRSVLEQIDDDGTRIDALLMVGDQIYADDLNFLTPDRELAEYNERYRTVFSQPHIRRLMSRVPTYMTLDDHEIEDNWPSRANAEDLVTKFPAAIHAYLTYQMSHSPLFEVSEDSQRLTGVPEKLWYTFRDGCCDFFMTDSRTERFLPENTAEREIIGSVQMAALKDWLDDGSGRVKLVASSVPFFPDDSRNNNDKWSGFLTQRTELLEFIRSRGIRRVVFLSGDIHASVSAELAHLQDPDFKVISIVSSAFFWPYPHPNSRRYVLAGELATSTGTSSYEVRNASELFSTDNFTRVSVNRQRVRVEVFSRKGDRLGTTVHSFA